MKEGGTEKKGVTYGFRPCGFNGLVSFGGFGCSGSDTGDDGDDLHEEGINDESILFALASGLWLQCLVQS